MSKKSNKVKFGLKNCHYAKATFDEDGSVTYAKPVRIPGAVSLSMDANGEIEPFYADNIAYYVVNNNSGYEGDLEIALIPESFLTDIMHEELDGNGVLSFVRSDHRSGAGCLLVPHHPHRLHGREDQLRSDPENHHSERQAQLLHSLCAEHPQGQQQAAG